jgi:DNA-binding NtrC family response regulator
MRLHFQCERVSADQKGCFQGAVQTVKEMIADKSILIVDPDTHFREELFNFLLSAGSQKVETAVNFHTALEKVTHSAYEVVLVDVGPPFSEGLKLAEVIIQLNPKMRVILMIKAEDRQKWNAEVGTSAEFQLLIKSAYSHDLLVLLEERS